MLRDVACAVGGGDRQQIDIVPVRIARGSIVRRRGEGDRSRRIDGKRRRIRAGDCPHHWLIRGVDSHRQLALSQAYDPARWAGHHRRRGVGDGDGQGLHRTIARAVGGGDRQQIDVIAIRVTWRGIDGCREKAEPARRIDSKRRRIRTANRPNHGLIRGIGRHRHLALCQTYNPACWAGHHRGRDVAGDDFGHRHSQRLQTCVARAVGCRNCHDVNIVTTNIARCREIWCRYKSDHPGRIHCKRRRIHAAADGPDHGLIRHKTGHCRLPFGH